MRAAIAAESAGIPSVSIVCDGFEGQARATARGLGFDGLPLAVTVGHVDAQTAEELKANFIGFTVDQVIDGLTSDEASSNEENSEPSAVEIVASGTIDQIQQRFLDEGWSDGHPIVPPTIVRVEQFLEGSGHDPWKTLGVAPSSGRDLTVWSIAVNAVMAGCRPEHLPILLAMAEILADPVYGSEHSGNTTGADAVVLVDGPNIEALGFNAGPGVMREGSHANTSVSRWLRLYLRNVLGFRADEHDKATFGNPSRPVLAQDRMCLHEIGWPTVSEQLRANSLQHSAAGSADDSADDSADGSADHSADDFVSMARTNSGTLIGSVFGSTPDEILPYLGNGLARVTAWDLTHVHGLGTDQYQPLLVVSPLIARVFGRAGWGLGDVQAGLFEHSKIPAQVFENFIGLWSNLSAGKPKLTDLVAEGLLPEVFARSDDPGRLVPIVTRPERLLVAVAGDPTRANAYALSNDGPHGWWTTKRVDHTPASDLVCQIGGDCGPAS